jgi:transposase InsO family protein
MCVSDNGTELTSIAILRWSQERSVDWHYIAPGKPQQNAFAESFIGRSSPPATPIAPFHSQCSRYQSRYHRFSSRSLFRTF